ncbi:MAG: mercury methylation corrinoid protein HgcA [Spirochaetia bacterium]
MSNCCSSTSCCGSLPDGGVRIPQVDSMITRSDKLKRLAFRLGIGRMSLTVSPGLYALGSPGPEDPVLVSANFKLTFDQLRGSLKGRKAWLLILDTKGINVWCAAGKGTFGTEELIRQIENSGLKMIISHRELILPQLGAPGIQAHEVRRRSGFRIHYGPVSLEKLGEYLESGMKATREMRRKTFTLPERAKLIPLELVQSWKVCAGAAALSLILTLILHGAGGLTLLYDVLPVLIALASGACITPLLLPYIPGRAFFLKGAFVGAVLSGLFVALSTPLLSQTIFILATVVAVSSFFAMNFTGASTFTSLSGVKKEMRYALPFQAALILIALAGRILAEVLQRGGAV